jgi:hypothetical protein
MRRTTWVAAALAAVLVVPLAGCSGSSAQLELLRADPIATAVPLGFQEETVSESAGGTTFGKRAPARMVREVVVDDAAAALVDLDEQALAAGWVADVPLDPTTDRAAVYVRTVDGQHLGLGLHADGTDEVVLTLHTP